MLAHNWFVRAEPGTLASGQRVRRRLGGGPCLQEETRGVRARSEPPLLGVRGFDPEGACVLLSGPPLEWDATERRASEQEAIRAQAPGHQLGEEPLCLRVSQGTVSDFLHV